jgi:hypothetical protein
MTSMKIINLLILWKTYGIPPNFKTEYLNIIQNSLKQTSCKITIKLLVYLAYTHLQVVCFPLHPPLNLNAWGVSSPWEDEDDKKLLQKSEMTAPRQTSDSMTVKMGNDIMKRL